MAEYFESVVAAATDAPQVTPKLISNWLSGEMFRLLAENQLEVSQVKIRPQDLVALIKLVTANTINQPAAKKTFGVMFETGRSPQQIVEELGLQQISDEGALVGVVQQVLTANPEAVESVKGGKEQALKFLVGQVMRATRGKANPQLAEQLLRAQMADELPQ
jgi:aspartyl-tRNA(Asn)/glutamyl-tRNA(Gln) amidotransferase subunit B